jgi:hypothetical protein
MNGQVNGDATHAASSKERIQIIDDEKHFTCVRSAERPRWALLNQGLFCTDKTLRLRSSAGGSAMQVSTTISSPSSALNQQGKVNCCPVVITRSELMKGARRYITERAIRDDLRCHGRDTASADDQRFGERLCVA